MPCFYNIYKGIPTKTTVVEGFHIVREVAHTREPHRSLYKRRLKKFSKKGDIIYHFDLVHFELHLLIQSKPEY